MVQSDSHHVSITNPIILHCLTLLKPTLRSVAGTTRFNAKIAFAPHRVPTVINSCQTFPLTTQYPFGFSVERPVIVHHFGLLDAQREQLRTSALVGRAGNGKRRKLTIRRSFQPSGCLRGEERTRGHCLYASSERSGFHYEGWSACVSVTVPSDFPLVPGAQPQLRRLLLRILRPGGAGQFYPPDRPILVKRSF
jgi:hypothetical protein